MDLKKFEELKCKVNMVDRIKTQIDNINEIISKINYLESCVKRVDYYDYEEDRSDFYYSEDNIKINNFNIDIEQEKNGVYNYYYNEDEKLIKLSLKEILKCIDMFEGEFYKKCIHPILKDKLKEKREQLEKEFNDIKFD